MESLFQLPGEIIITPLLQQFPCREHQIRALAALIHPDSIPCRNLVIHGSEATGKSAITEALLERVGAHIDERNSEADNALKYAKIDASQCITSRHLFERIIGSVATALDDDESAPRRCETLAQLAVHIGDLLRDPARGTGWRFVLVLDSIDKQRDAPATLLPALARLSEMIPYLTTIFIVTSPPAGFLRTPTSANLHFPPYSKQEFVRILSLTPPEPLKDTTKQETLDLWTRFCAAVHDSLVKAAARTLPAFHDCCNSLWPRFTAPILAGTHTPKEFSKLLVVARVHFQDESILNPSIVSVRPGPDTTNDSSTTHTGTTPKPAKSGNIAELTALLPTAARLLLLAAYLASHNATKHDLTLFSTYYHGRKRRHGGGTAAGRAGSRTKHRKIARKLLGAHAFVLERMMAIFAAVRSEWVDDGRPVGIAGVDGDIGMALATLASLRLLVRVGAGDMLDRSGKWRINVGWEAVRGIGRSIGVEVEEWLIE